MACLLSSTARCPPCRSTRWSTTPRRCASSTRRSTTAPRSPSPAAEQPVHDPGGRLPVVERAEPAAELGACGGVLVAPPSEPRDHRVCAVHQRARCGRLDVEVEAALDVAVLLEI